MSEYRFERVSSAQKMGFDTREAYHHPDWDHFKSHPETVGVVYPWVLEHDSEQYAIDNFEAVAKHITEGTPFENTNGPPDAEYKPWTVASLLEEAEKNRAKDTDRMAAGKIAVAAKMVAGHVEM